MKTIKFSKVFMQISSKKLMKITDLWWFRRVVNKVSMPEFEVSKGKKHSQKIGPKKVGPLYWVPPLLITWEGELTLFSTPLLIVSPHYVHSSLIFSLNIEHEWSFSIFWSVFVVQWFCGFVDAKGWQAGESSPFELCPAEAWHEELHGFGFLSKTQVSWGEKSIFSRIIWGIIGFFQTVWLTYWHRYNICVARLIMVITWYCHPF